MVTINRPPRGVQSKNITWVERPCRLGDPPCDSVLISGGDAPPQRLEWHDRDDNPEAMIAIGAGWLRELAARMHARGPTELHSLLLDLALKGQSLDALLTYWDQAENH
jgi:hypothetical protein